MNFNKLRDIRVAENIVPECLLHSPAKPLTVEIGGIRMDLSMCDGEKSLNDLIAEQNLDTDGTLDRRQAVRALKTLEKTGVLRLHYRRTFTQNDLSEAIRRMGVCTGDTLLVHSSIFAVGPLEDGAETLFAALEATVGSSGTICMPAFAYNNVKDYPDSPFDPHTTPSRTGALTNLFLKREGVIRSLHPSHGLAAKGSHAEEILQDNVMYSPYDARGAFGKLYRLDAKILMLGSGLAANSTLHAIEDWAALPSMIPDTYHYLEVQGVRCEVIYDKEPYFCRSFYKANEESTCYEEAFRAKGLLTCGDIGLAQSWLMRTRQIMDAGLNMAAQGDVDFLFCRTCASCQKIRKNIQENWHMPAVTTVL